MRLVMTLTLALTLPLTGLAQEGGTEGNGESSTPPRALRVAMGVGSSLDGAESSPNFFQYFMWERLNNFGLRVDSLKPIGDKRFDPYPAKAAKKWDKKEPGAPAATLQIQGTQTTKYDASKFYGEAQAHNFHGGVNATIVSKGEGGEKVIAEITFDFSWGKAVDRGTKSQIKRNYDQMMQTALALAVLNQKEIKAGVTSPKKQEQLKKWTDKECKNILKVLENSTEAVKNGTLANLLRKILESNE